MFKGSCVRECVVWLCNPPEITREDGTTLSDQREGSRNLINEEEISASLSVATRMQRYGSHVRKQLPGHECKLFSVCGLFQSSHWFTVFWPFHFLSSLSCSFPLSQRAAVVGRHEEEPTFRLHCIVPQTDLFGWIVEIPPLSTMKPAVCLPPRSNRLSTGPSVIILVALPSRSWPHSNQTVSKWAHVRGGTNEVFTNSGDTHSKGVQSLLMHGCTCLLTKAHVMTSAPLQPW